MFQGLACCPKRHNSVPAQRCLPRRLSSSNCRGGLSGCSADSACRRNWSQLQRRHQRNPFPTDLYTPLMSFLVSWHYFLQRYKICAAKSPNPIGNPISPRRVEWGLWRGEVGVRMKTPHPHIKLMVKYTLYAP